MEWLVKILSLIIFSLLGGIVFALTTHALIATGAMQAESIPESFGAEMTNKAVIVWMICVLIGLGSIFIKQKWRYILTASPLYMPAIFAIFYTLSAA